MARDWRILITGSRDWADKAAIEKAIRWWLVTHAAPEDTVTIVHGAARGADNLAHQLAEEWAGWGWRPEPHPADWDRYGKAAGHRRNAEMVSLGADVCFAFPLGESPGTRGCMELAERAGIPVINRGDWPIFEPEDLGIEGDLANNPLVCECAGGKRPCTHQESA